MLNEFLTANYKENDLIFLSDIHLPLSDINLRQQFKSLCDSGCLQRADKGIYYRPKQSIIKGGDPISGTQILESKYISRNDSVFGYYTGYTFANQLGLTLQVPYTLEITSNNTSQKYREVTIKGQAAILRSPKVRVDAENCKVLQFLDLLKDIDQLSDLSEEETRNKLKGYLQKETILQDQIDSLISLYPDKIYRNYYRMRLFDVLA